MLVLHHTVTPFWVGAAAARNVQAIAKSRGFVDISYSALATRADELIEGRGWGRQGAHTAGYNSRAHALSLVGNLDTVDMPPGMIRATVRGIRDHRRVGPGRITHGHRQLASTACPGRFAYGRINALNIAATGSPAPPPLPPPPPPPEEGFLMSLNDEQQLSVWRWLRALQHKSSAPVWLAEMDDRLKKLEARDAAPTLDQIALKVIETLSPEHKGNLVRVGDLNADAQRQFSMLVEAKVRALLAEQED
jgi:hypothetical protein